MKHPRRLDPIVVLGLALPTLAALPACNTEEIGPDEVLRDNDMVPAANQGSALVALVPPEETFAEFRASASPRGLFFFRVDGKKVVNSTGQLFTMPAANQAFVGNYEAGFHHFEVVAVSGATLFAGDVQIASGTVTSLYVFGAMDALQGRFVSYPLVPPGDSAHISAINLVRSGVEIELVSCASAMTCTPVSPPLALGDTFDADFPSSGLSVGASLLSASGVGFGYRQVASPSLPTPPILPVMPGYSVPLGQGANYAVAPEYLMPDGTCILAAH